MEVPTFKTSAVAWETQFFAITGFSVRVTAEVPSPGYKVSLEKPYIQADTSQQLILDLVLVQESVLCPEIGTVDTDTYQESISQGQYQSVLIRLPNGETLLIEEIISVPVSVSKDDLYAVPLTFFSPPNGTGGVTLSDDFQSIQAVSRIKLRDVGWREVRINWPPSRRCKGELWLSLSHPRINEIRDAVLRCLRVSAVTAVIADIALAIATNGATAGEAFYPAFKIAFKGCLVASGIGFAQNLDISLSVDNRECGRWGS